MRRRLEKYSTTTTTTNQRMQQRRRHSSSSFATVSLLSLHLQLLLVCILLTTGSSFAFQTGTTSLLPMTMIRTGYTNTDMPRMRARRSTSSTAARSSRLRVSLEENTSHNDSLDDDNASMEERNGLLLPQEMEHLEAASTEDPLRLLPPPPPTSQVQFTPQLLQQPQPYWCYWSTAYELTQAGIVGSMTGLLVAVFKLSIELMRRLCYEQDILANHPEYMALIPAFGGVLVGVLLFLGGPYPPGLRGTVQNVDDSYSNTNTNNGDGSSSSSSSSSPNLSVQGIWQEFLNQGHFFRKSTAAVVTLGTGCSLGPEGPCVEIGLNVARACTSFNRPVPSREAGGAVPATALPVQAVTGQESQSPQQEESQNQQQPAAPPPPVPLVVNVNPFVQPVMDQSAQRGWSRVLLSSGAAAGVAAGFNAPIAGVFFALEIMQNTFTSIDTDRMETAIQQYNTSVVHNYNNNNNNQFMSGLPPQPMAVFQSMTSTTTITPILIASVLSALVSHLLLGNELILSLSHFELETPILELPLYLMLGALSGVAAFVFTYSAKLSQQFFSGELGIGPIRSTMKAIPDWFKPAMGGLLCGLVGLMFPQILFFGYETLNSLLKNNTLPFYLILTLMGVKTVMTAVSAGSGLVGGTFAPSLFLGAMVGAAFHESATFVLSTLLTFSGSLAAASPSSAAEMANAAAHLGSSIHIADMPAYAMVGAASVLAALFRAPLTASLLLFEVTREYDVILPLMASAGVASIMADILEDRLERRDEMQRRDQDPVSWGDLADESEILERSSRDRLNATPSSSPSQVVDGVPTLSSSASVDSAFFLRRRPQSRVENDEEQQ